MHESILAITYCGNMKKSIPIEHIGVTFPQKGNFLPESTEPPFWLPRYSCQLLPLRWPCCYDEWDPHSAQQPLQF